MGTRPRPVPLRLGQKLKQIRTDRNLSQAELIIELNYEGVDLNQTIISKYEAGRREPPLPVLLRYARLGGVTLDVLVDDEMDLT